MERLRSFFFTHKTLAGVSHAKGGLGFRLAAGSSNLLKSQRHSFCYASQRFSTELETGKIEAQIGSNHIRTVCAALTKDSHGGLNLLGWRLKSAQLICTQFLLQVLAA